MTLAKTYRYYDNGEDSLVIGEPHSDLFTAYVEPIEDGFYVKPEDSIPLALNVLGHDIHPDNPLAASVSVEDAVVQLAHTPMARDFQLSHAAALLKAVDAYDKRAVRLATAEIRRQRALEALADSFARVNKPATEWTGDDVGKLREALGRYDAALAN